MIDIIIPAYNAHETIERTLLSICMQTINDRINVYIINDCSRYSYSDIINKFKCKINLKELTLDKNVGPGCARQYGIDNSKGEYIYFLDADDLFIDCFSLENLVNQIGDNDIISGNVFYETQNNNICAITNSFSFQLHGKLYKRKYIVNNGFHFNDSRKGEDNCFNRLLKIGTDKYGYSNSDISIYSYTKNSITNSEGDKYIYNEIPTLAKNMIWMAEEAEKRNFDCKKIVNELYNELFHFTTVYASSFLEQENFDILYDSFKMVYMKIKTFNITISLDDLRLIASNYVCDNLSVDLLLYLYNDLVNKVV